VTGASAGLGLEFARELARQGYDLVLVARRGARLEAVASEISAESGREVLWRAVDLAEPGAPTALHRELSAAGIDVDMLVNNAGSAGPDLLDDGDWPEHERYLRLMALSVAEMCHLWIPGMVGRGWGRVLNVSSIAALVPVWSGGHYGPTKRYLLALSEELAVRVAGHGVLVCAVCPGFTHTDFHDSPRLRAMKQASRRFLWYEPGVVVRDALRGLERGRRVVVTGRLYRWLTPILRLRLARWALRRRHARAQS
jgi:hypothetical protein